MYQGMNIFLVLKIITISQDFNKKWIEHKNENKSSKCKMKSV